METGTSKTENAVLSINESKRYNKQVKMKTGTLWGQNFGYSEWNADDCAQ